MSWLSFLIGVGLGVLLDYFLPREWSVIVLIVVGIAIVMRRLFRKRTQG